MGESFDSVVREYIDLINQYVGVYMDAMAGFAGHHTRVERQVHRVMRQTATRQGADGVPIVVWSSYEDPSHPDIVHSRTVRAEDYISANESGGFNEQQHARAVLIFLFTYWEDEIRPRLAASVQKPTKEIKSDIMGDLRILRNVILHAKGVLSSEKHGELRLLKDMFTIGQPVRPSYEDMHKIFVAAKQDCARMLFEWVGVKAGPISAEQVVGIAIERRGGKN